MEAERFHPQVQVVDLDTAMECLKQATKEVLQQNNKIGSQAIYTEANVRSAFIDYMEENGAYDEEIKETTNNFINDFLKLYQK